uniref:Uncharacterized protein n=1 Tax=Sander lucioperca TaxID=283035 RepID=A0A8D0DBS4_SANLU
MKVFSFNFVAQVCSTPPEGSISLLFSPGLHSLYYNILTLCLLAIYISVFSLSVSFLAGLESMRRLQRLSLDHNQLISTKGLRDVFTLLHLNCSHNHLASVEGLENSALLNTLDLRANSLTEVRRKTESIVFGCHCSGLQFCVRSV